MLHKKYKDLSKRPKPDFVVQYRFLDTKKTLPHQGYRSSFMYEEDARTTNEVKYAYDIFPEFKDEKGGIIMNLNEKVLREGVADMWILVEQSRNFHKEKMKIGSKGYFLEGTKIVAECEVIKIN